MANEYLNNKSFESIIKIFQFQKREKFRNEHIVQDLIETNDRRVKKYGDKQKQELLLKQELIYKESQSKFIDFQNQLATAFYILSQNIANYAKFSGIDIDDAVQEGVLICFEKIDRFDPRKGKAFNYMTTCILNHYRQLYRSAKNYNELKKKYQLFLSERFESIVFRNGRETLYNKTGD